MGQGRAPRAAQCAQQRFKCVWQPPAEPPASPRTSGPGLAATAASASSSSNTTRRGIAEESAGAARERPMIANGRVVVMTPGAWAGHRTTLPSQCSSLIGHSPPHPPHHGPGYLLQ